MTPTPSGEIVAIEESDIAPLTTQRGSSDVTCKILGSGVERAHGPNVVESLSSHIGSERAARVAITQNNVRMWIGRWHQTRRKHGQTVPPLQNLESLSDGATTGCLCNG